MSEAQFFATPADFRAWLTVNHERERELVVGFYKKGCGKPSITWPESVDEALCFGWIDGIRRRIDAESYSIRFTPRQLRSRWSAVNITRVEELTREGRMQAAGLEAFARRTEEQSETYAYEQRGELALDDAMALQFQAQVEAWSFFQAQAPWYRKKAVWWVLSAKREATRQRRLARLIALSAANERLA